MPELPHEQIAIVNIIWQGLLLSALVITLLECFKKSFVKEDVYRKHCRFWLKLAIFWYLIGSAYISNEITNFFGRILYWRLDSNGFIYFVGITLNFLLGYSCHFLILLTVSLIPAKLQNW